MNNHCITAIEVYNIASLGQYCGSKIPHGCLGIQINWDLKIEYYEKVKIEGTTGFALIGRCKHKFAHSIFHLAPGTTGGFANRLIKLKVEEPAFCFPKIKAKRWITYQGDLWDSVAAVKQAEKYLGYKLTDVGMKRSNDRGCYCVYNVPETLLTELLSKILVIAPSTQDFFSRHMDNYFNSLKE